MIESIIAWRRAGVIAGGFRFFPYRVVEVPLEIWDIEFLQWWYKVLGDIWAD
jgi:hypothetical protein